MRLETDLRTRSQNSRAAPAQPYPFIRPNIDLGLALQIMAEQEKTGESQPEESGHSEVKFFRQIEQTIEGGYEFVVRFVETSARSAFSRQPLSLH
jgi:hypothetical protein